MKNIITCLFVLSVGLPAADTFTKRASEIDPRAKEHPEIGFVFADKNGKPQDVQNASVDLSVKAQGKLVIWLMGNSAPLFERLNSYGLHAIRVHYANQWFGIIPAAPGIGWPESRKPWAFVEFTPTWRADIGFDRHLRQMLPRSRWRDTNPAGRKAVNPAVMRLNANGGYRCLGTNG